MKNKKLSKSIKEMKNAMNQNGNLIKEATDGARSLHNKIMADGVLKLIKKEKEKELLLLKTIKRNQYLCSEKGSLELNLKQKLKEIQNHITILKQSYYSNLNMTDKDVDESGSKYEGVEIPDLKSELAHLQFILETTRQKNKVKIQLLKKEIDFTKSKLCTQKLVYFN
eukprot:TRINITY_DN9527_c0_g6_i2.p2 TRINITY_DN9527_c0_g6~~TRINITY_DN9527_c0_g6_i2.p2  ORF type:complete len:168 (-),score=30.77 TRINITY_DN9527_c0_g6_i2:403-906(-)